MITHAFILTDLHFRTSTFSVTTFNDGERYIVITGFSPG